MGGEGTINSMIISLKNNSKLLIRRKTFFDRKHSHAELRRIYSKRIHRNDKQLTEQDKRKIRESIKAEIKRENRVKLLVVFSCMILIPALGYFAFSGHKPSSEQINNEIKNGRGSLTYDESISIGLLNLDQNKPFFAIAHFENALNVKPSDQLAIEKLIASYQMLCELNEKTCEMARAKVDSLRKEMRYNLPAN